MGSAGALARELCLIYTIPEDQGFLIKSYCLVNNTQGNYYLGLNHTEEFRILHEKRMVYTANK